jgi:hypothetical protein
VVQDLPGLGLVHGGLDRLHQEGAVEDPGVAAEALTYHLADDAEDLLDLGRAFHGRFSWATMVPSPLVGLDQSEAEEDNETV